MPERGFTTGDTIRRPGRWTVTCCVASIFLALSIGDALAQAAITDLDAQQGATATDTGPQNNGQDFTRPQNLFQLRDQYKTSPGTTRPTTTETVTLRADRWFTLAPQWQFVLRTDLPFVDKNPFNSDNPSGDFIDGLGDADLQGALIHTFDARWAAGAGMRLIAPTGEENLTSEKWRLMPIVGARAMLPEISRGTYFEALVRYDVSVAGDPLANSISNLQFAPMLNVSLPDQWFITFYPTPDIRVNFGDPVTGQRGRLFLPFDALIGRKLTNNWTASLEIGVPIVRDYPVYDFKTEGRLNFNY